MAREWMELETAQQLLLGSVNGPDEAEELPLDDALGRVCAAAVKAAFPMPPFSRSPLDGYTLHSGDTVAATPKAPLRLPVARTLYAGDPPGPPLLPGQAVRIMTGAMLPAGANCVVRQEDTREEGGHLLLPHPLAPNENLVFAGEDYPAGETLLQPGDLLTPARLGLLAGQGFLRATVYRRPPVAVASTGSELAERGRPLREGQIYDSNSHMLTARVRQLGGNLTARACLPDEPETLLAELDRMLGENRLTVTTGGVSVGAKDYLPAVAQKLGGRLLFHGVNLKPGGPALALCREGRLLLCLSGNPFAALATFEVLAVPVLKKLAGETGCTLKRARGTAREGYAKKSPGRRLVRARIEGDGVFIPPLGHASGMLHSFPGCNCFIDLPAGSEGIRQGETVEVILLA